jgi:quercetin dioxygenase-like cupin family protein
MSDVISPIYFLDTKSKAIFSSQGTQPHFLIDTPNFKSLVVGLNEGQQIPPHPGGTAMYHFLEGEGLMMVDDEVFDIKPGVTIVAPNGTKRGMTAKTRVIFLAAKSES